MASIYTNVNMVANNRKQIQTAARNLSILHDNTDTAPILLAKVKAK